MSIKETSTDSKPRWGALAKGAVGTAVVAIGGYLGAAMMQVISAPKDSVAYDFIQSATGMLKPAPEKPSPAPEPPQAVASQPTPRSPEPKIAAVAPKATPDAPAPSPPPPPGSSPSHSAPSAPLSPPSATPPSSTTAAPSPAPGGTMLDRVQQTARLADQARASTAALANSRVLSLADRARTPICGADYEIEVSSVAAGAGQVALRRPDGSAEPIALAVGQQPKELGAGCRIVLLGTMEDLTNRRAQLREIGAN